MSLNKEQIVGASKLERVELEIPEWGGTVFIAEMTGRQRDAWEASIVEIDEKTSETRHNRINFRAKLAIRVVVDENGVSVFGDDDIELVGKLSSAALDRVFEAAQKINKITPDDIEELGGN